MGRIVSIFLFSILISLYAGSQNLYFPPTSGEVWDTMAPTSLGWCEPKIDSLYYFLETNNTHAFILLKDGKIVLEKYFGDFEPNDAWYWASAGKTITAFMVGMAQQEGYLSLADPTSDYLGPGWTSLTPEQEEQITIWHQLTMT
ncbi:MAG: serine hydrolase, partial [Bacteroidales bacterium]